jgi:hypothetical protein
MARNFGSPSPTQPLSVGDIVSAAFQLYRSHLKQYLSIAVQATLWLLLPMLGLIVLSGLGALMAATQSNLAGLIVLLIPAVIVLFIYCGTKAQVYWVLISWLAYGEMIQQPESTQAGRRLLLPRLWRFFRTLALVGLLGLLVSIGLYIAQLVITLVTSAIFGSESPLSGLIALIVSLASTGLSLWFSARWFLPELAVAVENSTALNSIERSWDLTKGQAIRVMTVLFIGGLITLPLYVLAFVPLVLALIASYASLASGNESAIIGVIVGIALSLLLVLAISLFVTPFSQTLKAVMYYDLRSRREGLDLRLRPRDAAGES